MMTERFVKSLSVAIVLSAMIIALGVHAERQAQDDVRHERTISNVQRNRTQYDTICAYDPAIGRIVCRMIRK